MTRDIEFQDIDQIFLAQSREWLADIKFRKLIMADKVDERVQSQWYKKLSTRNDYKIWGAKFNKEWVGACGLKHIDKNKQTAEYWGYIYPVKLRGKGFGREMLNTCCRYGEELRLKSLYLTVAQDNISAQAAYRRWGFCDIDRGQSDQITMELKV